MLACAAPEGDGWKPRDIEETCATRVRVPRLDVGVDAPGVESNLESIERLIGVLHDVELSAERREASVNSPEDEVADTKQHERMHGIDLVDPWYRHRRFLESS
jgi:hypothetical protein